MTGLPPWLANKQMKPGNAAEDKLDGGMDDAQERPIPKNKKKKGNVPPQLQAAIARKLGAK